MNIILVILLSMIALKVIPEGSEFLMRWRYSDMRRFLEGETITPEEVFNGIHHLFTTYVDSVRKSRAAC
jgi:DNA phosphorothioation-dependent restriction protein DptG